MPCKVGLTFPLYRGGNHICAKSPKHSICNPRTHFPTHVYTLAGTSFMVDSNRALVPPPAHPLPPPWRPVHLAGFLCHLPLSIPFISPFAFAFSLLLPLFPPTPLSYLIKLLFLILSLSCSLPYGNYKCILSLPDDCQSSVSGIMKWDMMKNQCHQILKPLKAPRGLFQNLHKGTFYCLNSS